MFILTLFSGVLSLALGSWLPILIVLGLWAAITLLAAWDDTQRPYHRTSRNRRGF